MDLAWDDYQQHVHDVIAPETIAACAKNIRSGGKFEYANGAWKPVPYPGIAIVSMVNEDAVHNRLTSQLQPIAEALGNAIAAPDAVYRLPPASYHQTIANTFSGARYRDHIMEPGLEDAFPKLIEQAFDGMPASVIGKPIQLRLIGLTVLQTCIALSAEIPEESDYERILTFRDGVYEFSPLKSIGLERTRPFIGHVTLAYFGRALSEPETQSLVKRLEQLNKTIANDPPVFAITQTAPRWYDDLSEFQAPSRYPSFGFLGD